MSLHFPPEKQVEEAIQNAPFLKNPYFKNKGITDAVAELAKQKFAGEDLIDFVAKLGAAHVVDELRQRKFAGEELTDVIWSQVSRETEKALKDCLVPNKK